MGDFFGQMWDILKDILTHLRDPNAWKETLGRPEVFWPALAVLAFIIFAETGLLVGFFLPGDSLLVTVGIVAHTVGWNIWGVMAALMLAAIVGNNTGYFVGAKAGPRLFNRPKSWWFKRDHLLTAKAFFDTHGGKTVILAQFMPFARTFVPVVAGAAGMPFRTFFLYNVAGAVLWIGSMLLFGYYAVDALNPMLRPIFGEDFDLSKKIDILALVIIVLSLTPMAVHMVIKWVKRRKEKKPELASGQETGDKGQEAEVRSQEAGDKGQETATTVPVP